MVKIISTRKLAYEILKIPKEELLALVADADNFYSPYDKTTVKDGNTSKTRRIEPSTGYLKVVQRRIDRRILKPAINSLPPEIMGGRPGVSVVDNAKLHAKSKALMKYDIQNFFPSITYSHVYHIFRYRLNFGEEAANILTKLTTYPSDNPHTPQGAPTSTSLSMLTLEPLVKKLAKYTKDNNMKFSVWVDDIIISGDYSTLKTHRGHINYLVNSTPYIINPNKNTGIVKKGAAVTRNRKIIEKGRKITGITIDSTNNPTLGRSKLKNPKGA